MGRTGRPRSANNAGELCRGKRSTQSTQQFPAIIFPLTASIKLRPWDSVHVSACPTQEIVRKDKRFASHSETKGAHRREHLTNLLREGRSAPRAVRAALCVRAPPTAAGCSCYGTQLRLHAVRAAPGAALRFAPSLPAGNAPAASSTACGSALPPSSAGKKKTSAPRASPESSGSPPELSAPEPSNKAPSQPSLTCPAAVSAPPLCSLGPPAPSPARGTATPLPSRAAPRPSQQQPPTTLQTL